MVSSSAVFYVISMAKITKSSKRWLDEHFSDPFVQQARQEGYRGRAVYKLRELDERYGLFRRGMQVIDLGAAPGSWSEYLSRRYDGGVQVVASDILPMDPLPDVTFVQGDFTDDAVLQALLDTLDGCKADFVISDMAPNMSGNAAVDQPRAMYLAELALALAEQVLARQGGLLVKLFQGEGFDDYCADLRQMFATVTVKKPKASRPRSREVFMVGLGFKG
jgi:23S rRNA (uridine2552-2'-O)-methyltransferase